MLKRNIVAEIDIDAIDALLPQIQRLRHKLELIGGIDEEAMGEYREVKERHDFLHTQYKDLVDASAALEEVITELDLKISKQFTDQFKNIAELFTKYFKILFGGGTASLVKVMEEFPDEILPENLTEADAAVVSDVADLGQESAEGISGELQEPKTQEKKKIFSGIDINASPPGKKVKHITALSGGEKALTSIALISAIIANNPSPFVILDEVDAALDESNSEKFADIVEQLSNKTQFIVITHNRATMKRSHILYGVTAGEEGISHLLSIKLEQAEKIAKR